VPGRSVLYAVVPASAFDAPLPAIFVTSVIELAVARGASRTALLAASGASPAELASPEKPVPVAAVFATWAAAMRALGDPSFPMVYAGAFSIESYPILGFAVLTAASGREAFARAIRFGAIVGRSGAWSMVEAGDVLTLRWTRAGERTLGMRVANEAAVAEMISSTRQSLATGLRATAVRFRHLAPRDVRAHEAYFGGPVSWGCEEDAIDFPRAILDALPRHANRAMSSYFEGQAVTRLAESEAREDERLVDKVARIVDGELLDGEPSLGTVARKLAMSDRTLRRGLVAEQTTFRAIVDRTRTARAKALMADPRVSLAEVAFALGFSEHAAFTRAFKRWTGSSPAAARRAE
jgi:AraC-like DNA-binding protein